MSNEVRKSYIQKTLEVKLNIGNYSTIGASVAFGEDIEWATQEERAKKLKSISAQLRKELKNDVNTFLLENGLRDRTDIMLDNAMKQKYDG